MNIQQNFYPPGKFSRKLTLRDNLRRQNISSGAAHRVNRLFRFRDKARKAKGRRGRERRWVVGQAALSPPAGGLGSTLSFHSGVREKDFLHSTGAGRPLWNLLRAKFWGCMAALSSLLKSACGSTGRRLRTRGRVRLTR